MANQYCKITSWIQHHKDHGDNKYAEAISDLCLDSWLSPSRYPGLTFLYQTNKKVRKEFCDRVFTPESREAAEDFKRYILPNVFHSCEDFQKKDVGNVLGYKYEIKSCDKHKVVFENGMEIHPLLHHNSFEPLNPKLKDIIKVYYVVKGEPPESGDPYKIPRSTHRSNRRDSGDNFAAEAAGGNIRASVAALTNSPLVNALAMADGASFSGAYTIFNSCLDILDGVSGPFANNLILIQWYLNSVNCGIFTYAPSILLLLSAMPGENKEDIDLAISLISIIVGGIHTPTTDSAEIKNDYFNRLEEKSKSLGFNKTKLTNSGAAKLSLFQQHMSTLEGHNHGPDILHQLFNKLYESAKLWDGYHFPELQNMGGGDMHIASKYIFLLQAQCINLFIFNALEDSNVINNINLIMDWYRRLMGHMGNREYIDEIDNELVRELAGGLGTPGLINIMITPPNVSGGALPTKEQFYAFFKKLGEKMRLPTKSNSTQLNNSIKTGGGYSNHLF
jgi:hypothetical protein